MNTLRLMRETAIELAHAIDDNLHHKIPVLIETLRQLHDADALASAPPKGDTISFKPEDIPVTDSLTEGYVHIEPQISWEPTLQLRWFKTKMGGANLQQLWWERGSDKSEWRAVGMETSE